jgi:hypothetical protein
MVDKPPSPIAEKSTLGSSKPQSPKGAHGPTGAKGAPTSLTCATSSHDTANTPPSPSTAEDHEVSPLSPRSYGLRAPDRVQPGEGSSVPQSEKQPWQYLRVAVSLWDNPDFI